LDLKIFDFGRNAYQFSVFLKFPYISGERITEALQQLVAERKVFRFVVKGEAAAPLTLSVGEGSEAAPLFQLKVGTDTVSLFAGWFVRYDDWMKWRDSLIPSLENLLRGVPGELVLSLFSQCSSPIPTERVKRRAEILELKPFEEFFQRFIPAEFREKGNAFITLSDAANRQAVEFFLGGWGTSTPIPGYENVFFNTRLNLLESGADLKKALQSHVFWSDTLLEKFHSQYLSLFVKP
jgi:hypothetical protein